MYQKIWWGDVHFLRYGARQTDGQTDRWMDGWKKWHRGGCPNLSKFSQNLFAKMWNNVHLVMSEFVCSNAGCRKTFKYCMERKRHTEHKKCLGTPHIPEVKSIGKENDYYKYLLCLTIINHKNNITRHIENCKKRLLKVKFARMSCSKGFD